MKLFSKIDSVKLIRWPRHPYNYLFIADNIGWINRCLITFARFILEKFKIICFFWGQNRKLVRRIFKIAQKAIEGCPCHMIAYAFDFELAQNSNHSAFLIFLIEISITCQNSKLADLFKSENPDLAQNSKRN